MKAIDYKPHQRVFLKGVLGNMNTDRLKHQGFLTDNPPVKIDGLVRVEVRLDDGNLVLKPIHVVSLVVYRSLLTESSKNNDY